MKLPVIPLMFLAAAAGCNGNKDDTKTNKPKDTGPDEITDSFVQSLSSPVDILWAVDGGWGEGLDALQDVEILKDTLEIMLVSGTDWRMGVTSTNTTGGLFGIIGTKWDTYPPPSNAFALPPSSTPPRIRDSIYTALELRKESPQNVDFVRADAHLYVVAFTDDQDTSEEVSEGDFEEWFDGFTPSASKRMGAITSGDSRDYWEDKAIGGTVADVGSFRKALESILRDAMNQRTEFTLSRIPVDPPEEITLVHREREETLEIEDDYLYDEDTQTISLLEIIPEDKDEIIVVYESEKVEGGEDEG